MGRTLVHVAERMDVELEFVWNRTPREEAAGSDSLYGDVDALVDAIARRSGGEGRAIWLTVADDAILPVAGRLADVVSEHALILHTSGSLETREIRQEGIDAPTAGVHPLLAITEPERAAERFERAFWTVEGDEPAVAFAMGMLEALGAEVTELQAGRRTLYHAAAVLASNLEVALLDAAVEVARESGLDQQRAVDMLRTLASSALENVDANLGPDSLSGPVARGDDGTIKRHRQALEEAGLNDVLDVYERLTRRARRMVDGDEDVGD
jgi:predicted short-subunit dehydrogenase-like oxidoreductase (DUF2520 family)